MKLELDIKSAPNQSVSADSVSPNGFDSNGSEEVKKLLRHGINAAKEGNRAEARLTLLQVTEAEQDNETAWLWLASISEYPEELLVFLQNVLKINPDNERAIEWAKQTKTLLSKTFVQRGIDASHQNQKDFAKQCFLQAIVHDTENEMAWLWLASSTDSIEEKCSHLQKVLKINPDNETAVSSMKSVKNQIAQPLLKKATTAAISGDLEAARQSLEEVMKYTPELEEAWILKAYLAVDFYAKIACYEKALEINPNHDAAQAGLASLKALAPKVEVKAKEIPVEEKIETVEPDAVLEPENLLETPAEVVAIAPEFEELLSEVFDAPTSELDESYAQHVEESFAQSNLQSDEIVEELAPEPAFELVEEPVAQVEEFAVESQNEVQFAPLATVEEPPTDSAELVAETQEIVGETAPPSVENIESVAEFTDEPQAETEFTPDVVESAATPDFQTENYVAEETHSVESETANVTEAAETHETDWQEYQHSVAAEAVAVEEHVEEVAEPVADQPETQSTNSFSTFTQAETYADYQQPTVEFSYQTANPYSDPSADTLTQYSAPETVIPQPNYFFAEPPSVAETETFAVEEKVEEVTESVAVTDEVEEVQTQVFTAPEVQAAPVQCPFCTSENEPQAVVCASCEAMLSLSDLEMLLAHQTANQAVLLQAIEKMEVEKTIHDFDVDELTNLGIAHLNAHNLRKGFTYLQEASQLNPNDVVLSSKVNFLAIRLNEIEEYDQKAQEHPVQSRTILVVDDSPTVRKLISGKLEKCGHSVISAVDGMDALAKINEVIPDLILLDITMPRLDGYQVCKLIRNNDITKDIPVVMISGKDGFFDKVRGRMAGSSGYITKPFGPDTLMKTIENYLA